MCLTVCITGAKIGNIFEEAKTLVQKILSKKIKANKEEFISLYEDIGYIDACISINIYKKIKIDFEIIDKFSVLSPNWIHFFAN